MQTPMSQQPQQQQQAPQQAGVQETGMEMGQMMQYIQTLPEPERTQALEALSRNYGGEREGLNEQLESAKMLRDGATTDGVQAGNMYVAGNPLSHIADGMQKYQSGEDIKRLRGEKEGLNDSYQQGIRGVQDAMLG
jgi:hypothetical protein